MQEIGEIAKKHVLNNKKGADKQMDINEIPNNRENMSFILGKHLVLLESFQFMSSSLDKLSSNFPDETFKYTSEFLNDRRFKLVTQEGVHPCDCMDSFETFNKKLPTKDEFYSIQQDEHISNEQCKHAQNVWQTFNHKAMGQYHDLYLKSDFLC